MIGKKIVLHIKKNYNYFHKKKTTCTFLYIQKEKIANCFNIQKGRPFAKSKTIIVTFLYTKNRTLYFTQFLMENLNLAFIYNMTL